MAGKSRFRTWKPTLVKILLVILLCYFVWLGLLFVDSFLGLGIFAAQKLAVQVLVALVVAYLMSWWLEPFILSWWAWLFVILCLVLAYYFVLPQLRKYELTPIHTERL